jgi:hypothetical protein
VMAEVMDMTRPALTRWIRRSNGCRRDRKRRGRPEVIPPSLVDRIRACYVAHYRQWGPRVLAEWCRRQKLGEWSPSTIARVIADLRPKPEATPRPVRYEVTRSGVMWSEDGTGFCENGRKKELLVLQDEHSRLKLSHRLVAGPADEEAVYDYLAAAFSEHGPPLVLKHDGGSIFHGDRIRRLLAEHGVVDLTGPRRYPQYNGKQERSMRDIKSFERAMRRHGVHGRLGDRVDAAIRDLNEERPRPVLGGRTAREAHRQDRGRLPDRRDFIAEVDRLEDGLRSLARSRNEREASRRRAVELSLLCHGLIVEWGDVSRNSLGRRRTN